jgi:hypothetical protein
MTLMRQHVMSMQQMAASGKFLAGATRKAAGTIILMQHALQTQIASGIPLDNVTWQAAGTIRMKMIALAMTAHGEALAGAPSKDAGIIRLNWLAIITPNASGMTRIIIVRK